MLKKALQPISCIIFLAPKTLIARLKLYAVSGLGLSFLKTELAQIELGDIQVDDPYEVIFRDQFLQRDREQAGLATGLSLYVGHNEKCSVSFDTEHSLKGPDRLLGFHTVCFGPFLLVGMMEDMESRMVSPADLDNLR